MSISELPCISSSRSFIASMRIRSRVRGLFGRTFALKNHESFNHWWIRNSEKLTTLLRPLPRSRIAQIATTLLEGIVTAQPTNTENREWRITLNPSIQKIKYYGWWTWKTLHFEIRSFCQDRPPEISFEISARTWCYSSKIDLFITIAPEKFRSKYLNIAPNCAQRGKFCICWNASYHVNIFSISGNG